MTEGAGAEITALLPDMLQSLGAVTSLCLVELPGASPMQHRLDDRAAVEPLLDRVRDLRSVYRIPFWAAVMLLVGDEAPDVRESVLNAALFHQASADAGRVTEVRNDGRLQRRMQELVADVPTGRFVALRSGVVIEGTQVAHIPMLDFRWEPTDANLSITAETVRALGLGGWIFDSGRSFHFYGDRLLPTSHALSAFLGKALLLMPIVDQRWIAHQLIEGGCALRISSGGSSQRTPVLRTYLP